MLEVLSCSLIDFLLRIKNYHGNWEQFWSNSSLSIAVKLQELIELVWKIIENDGYSSWIFFDEMSDVVNEKDLPEAVQLSLKTTLGEKFKVQIDMLIASVR